MLRSTGKVAIVLFCIWHMTVIAAYAAPDYIPASLKIVREKIVYVSSPYILLTSQWQKWNLFSPDPLRRVVTFHIDKETKDGWEEIAVIGHETVAWWHKATELKTVRRTEESEGGDNLQPLRERYILEYCSTLSAGTKLRLRRISYVIPMYVTPPTIAEWSAYTPETNQDFDVLVTCPSK